MKGRGVDLLSPDWSVREVRGGLWEGRSWGSPQPFAKMLP